MSLHVQRTIGLQLVVPRDPAIGQLRTTQPSSGGQDSLKRQLRNYEQAIIKAAIEEANGDRKVAADRLGIGVSSLYRKLDSSIEA